MDSPETDELVRILCEIVLSAVPDAQSVSKYGGTLYTLKPQEKEGQFCGVFHYNSDVQLAISQGNKLTDTMQYLEEKGKYRRHINFSNSQNVNKNALCRMSQEAAESSRFAGKETSKICSMCSGITPRIQILLLPSFLMEVGIS